MKVTRHICDRCKKEFEGRCHTGILKIGLKRLWYRRSDDDIYKYELCEECTDSFYDWLLKRKGG